MSVRSYSPEGRLASWGVGIVLFNHMGSCVLGDTGRDAQYVANTLGVHVVAADRPGSGPTYPGQGKRLASDYIGAVSRLAARGIMPEVQALGLDRVVAAGRSAGGLAALMAVCTEQLPAVAVHAQEPVGWRQMSVKDGRDAFDAYQAEQRAMVTDNRRDLVRPDPTDQVGWRGWIRTATIWATAPVDKANNASVWSQDLAMESAFTIAARHPQVRADILFAEHSMVATPAEVAYLQRQLPIARGQNAGAAPITAWTESGTVHASFDQRAFSAARLDDTLTAILLPPEA